MNVSKCKRAFTSAMALIFLFGPCIDAALAQASTNNTEPPLAPSFLKQAGQKIFESTQKKVIEGLNDRLQQQPSSQPSPDPLAATGASSTQRQLAPCRSWVNPRERPIACLLCIHGLGLQSKSYEYFGNEESKRGLAVYAIDVRGFGSWMQARGKAKVNFDECLEDIKQTLESIRAANPGLPVYILGESMGGAIALRAASMYPDLVDGLISSVPAGERFKQGKTSAKVFLNLLSGFDLANVGGDILNQATKNSMLKSQWANDPLARLNLSPQELIQFQDFMNNNHEAAKRVDDMPVLFVQGIGDTLVKPEGTWELFNAVAAKDKSFFAVPGEHLIFEEAQTQEPGPRDQNFRVIQSWLSAKVGRRHRRGGMARAGMGRPDGYGGPRAYDGAGGGTGGAYGDSPRGAFASRRLAVNTQGLEVPSQLIDMGQYAQAISELERVKNVRPGDANVLGLLGRAYFLNGQADKASALFRSAMRVGRRGSDQARALNAYLLDVNRDALSNPQAASQIGVNQSSAVYPFLGFGGFSGLAGTAGGGSYAPSSRGRVYAFYASWADQCKGLDTVLSRLSTMYSDKVDITRVDIEDASSDALVDQFNVGPIPTVVFVAPDGKVASTIIGESNFDNYSAAVRAMESRLR